MFRFFFGLLNRRLLVCGDPHPGNLLLCHDGRVCFLDFGLARHLRPEYLEEERALARAVQAGDAQGVHDGLSRLGYLPEPDTFEPEQVLDQLAVAGEWYFVSGFKRLTPDFIREAMEVSGSPRSPHFEHMRRQTIPPEALLLRRMEALLFSVLGELRAGGDWGELAREYFAEQPPSTPLGEVEAAWLGRSAGASVGTAAA